MGEASSRPTSGSVMPRKATGSASKTPAKAAPPATSQARNRLDRTALGRPRGGRSSSPATRVASGTAAIEKRSQPNDFPVNRAQAANASTEPSSAIGTSAPVLPRARARITAGPMSTSPGARTRTWTTRYATAAKPVPVAARM